MSKKSYDFKHRSISYNKKEKQTKLPIWCILYGALITISLLIYIIGVCRIEKLRKNTSDNEISSSNGQYLIYESSMEKLNHDIKSMESISNIISDEVNFDEAMQFLKSLIERKEVLLKELVFEPSNWIVKVEHKSNDDDIMTLLLPSGYEMAKAEITKNYNSFETMYVITTEKIEKDEESGK
ncbi:MAG: hypothetical protein GXZ11_01060 [Tissierellia bacterium]|nr:hypothetical protein [Tissierellia bacterium]